MTMSLGAVKLRIPQTQLSPLRNFSSISVTSGLNTVIVGIGWKCIRVISEEKALLFTNPRF